VAGRYASCSRSLPSWRAFETSPPMRRGGKTCRPGPTRRATFARRAPELKKTAQRLGAYRRTWPVEQTGRLSLGAGGELKRSRFSMRVLKPSVRREVRAFLQSILDGAERHSAHEATKHHHLVRGLDLFPIRSRPRAQKEVATRCHIVPPPLSRKARLQSHGQCERPVDPRKGTGIGTPEAQVADLKELGRRTRLRNRAQGRNRLGEKATDGLRCVARTHRRPRNRASGSEGEYTWSWRTCTSSPMSGRRGSLLKHRWHAEHASLESGTSSAIAGAACLTAKDPRNERSFADAARPLCDEDEAFVRRVAAARQTQWTAIGARRSRHLLPPEGNCAHSFPFATHVTKPRTALFTILSWWECRADARRGACETGRAGPMLSNGWGFAAEGMATAFEDGR